MKPRIISAMTFALVGSIAIMGASYAKSARAIPTAPSSNVSSLGQSLCQAEAVVGNVKYLGKHSGFDTIEVDWTVPRTAQHASSDFSGRDSQGTACFVLGGSIGTFAVNLKIVRKLGHQDTGSGSAGGRLDGPFVCNVQVPRGTLELDPASYEVILTAAPGVALKKQVVITGNGVPSLGSAVQTTPDQGGQLVPPECLPGVTITGLSYSAGTGGQKDCVTVSWTTTVPSSGCLSSIGVGVAVKLNRSDGSVGTGSGGFPSTAPSGTVPVSGTPGNVTSFEITVTSSVSGTLSLGGSKKGNF